MLAYFLGLGVAAHSLDQLQGMGSKYVKLLSDDNLIIIGVSSLVASILIGLRIMIDISAWYLLILIPLQVFFVFAYPMKTLFKGFFHDDYWFAVSFGFLPVIIGNYINTLSFSSLAILWGIVTLMISGIEINLSRYVRKLRKTHCYNGKPYNEMIKKPEMALKLLCLMTYLLAAIMIGIFN